MGDQKSQTDIVARARRQGQRQKGPLLEQAKDRNRPEARIAADRKLEQLVGKGMVEMIEHELPVLGFEKGEFPFDLDAMDDANEGTY